MPKYKAKSEKSNKVSKSDLSIGNYYIARKHLAME